MLFYESLPTKKIHEKEEEEEEEEESFSRKIKKRIASKRASLIKEKKTNRKNSSRSIRTKQSGKNKTVNRHHTTAFSLKPPIQVSFIPNLVPQCSR